MPGPSCLQTRRRRPLVMAVALALLVSLGVSATAIAASNGIKVHATKKKLTITGTAVNSGDSIQVNFDPHKCAATFAAEGKRKKVAFTDFVRLNAGHFTETIRLPIPPPTGGKPGHYACTYLLKITDNDTNFKVVASTSGKY
jgi:hypothetical protein